ncbi:MAG TPA: DUF5995 family protein [Acidobacteriota bacterium]|nr:DUF5995 family protein [Acidobacteriota bacterium]
MGQILEDLETVVVRSLRDSDRIGYFAAFHGWVVKEVQIGLERGYFVDAERVERLHCNFSRRYLEALASYRHGNGLARCWRSAFEAASSKRFLILQHLLLALNAHVNLDLGIAVNRVAPSAARLKEVESDFVRLCRILDGMVGQVQRRIVEISPWIGLLDRMGQRKKGRFVDFSTRAAGKASWKVSKDLSVLNSQQQRELLRTLDGAVMASQRRLEGRKPHVRLAMWLVRRKESSDIRRNIQFFQEGFGTSSGEVIQSLLSHAPARLRTASQASGA